MSNEFVNHVAHPDFALPNGIVHLGLSIDLQPNFPLQIAYNEIETAEKNQVDAEIDVLTGLQNRRAWFKKVAEVNQNNRWTDQGLIIAVGDIDHFSAANRKLGHTGGDNVLIGVAEKLNSGIRNGDNVYRYGGEEFVLVMQAVAIEIAKARVELIRKSIQNMTIDGHTSTMSFGIAVRNDNESLSDTFMRADSALYDSKDNGRNQTTIWQPN